MKKTKYKIVSCMCLGNEYFEVYVEEKFLLFFKILNRVSGFLLTYDEAVQHIDEREENLKREREYVPIEKIIEK